MTGRDLIIYILENNLENEPVFKDGKFVGYMSAIEVAEKMDVGIATIFTWWSHGMLDGIVCGGKLYIPAMTSLQRFDDHEDNENGGKIT